MTHRPTPKAAPTTPTTPTTTPPARQGLSATLELHARLLSHQPAAPTDQALIAPGQPEASWLYTLLAQCDPHTRTGDHYPHTPYNSPALLEPALVALVRDWIAAGAPDN
jgi:hypothetical protein